MIVTLTEILAFLDVGVGFFTVDASHNVLILNYDEAGDENVEVDDGTYTGIALAANLETKIDAKFTISSTVTYDTTTKKFTISVPSNDIAFTHAGSNAALLFGFNQDHATASSITSDVAASDPSAIISVIHNSVEDWVQNHCYRKFEDSLYVQERHDGNGHNIIYFEQYPLLVVNLNGLVWTTDKKVTRSDGGSFITDGFEAGDKVLIQNSDKNSGLLTIDSGGVEALVLTFTDTIIDDTSDDNVVLSLFRELWIDDTEVDKNNYTILSDHIYYSGGFSRGLGNIRLTYYIRYSIININDLKLAIKIIVKAICQARQEEIFGKKTYKVGDIWVTCEDSNVPKEASDILEKYRKVEI